MTTISSPGSSLCDSPPMISSAARQSLDRVPRSRAAGSLWPSSQHRAESMNRSGIASPPTDQPTMTCSPLPVACLRQSSNHRKALWAFCVTSNPTEALHPHHEATAKRVAVLSFDDSSFALSAAFRSLAGCWLATSDSGDPVTAQVARRVCWLAKKFSQASGAIDQSRCRLRDRRVQSPQPTGSVHLLGPCSFHHRPSWL